LSQLLLQLIIKIYYGYLELQRTVSIH
jgi:hypothetical protein